MPYLRVKNELPLIPGYAEGSVAYATGAAAAILNRCICTGIYTQEGSGTPSPDNLRRINGYTEINIDRKVGDTVSGTFTVSFSPNTIYRFTLNVLTGELTYDMVCDQMLYSEVSGLSSDYIGYDSNRNAVWVRNWHYQNMKKPVQGGINAVCNSYDVIAMDAGIVSTQYRIYFVGASSVQDFLSNIQTLEASNDGLFVCYQLENPVTLHLTPEEVDTILGDQSFSHDANGDTKITYIRRLDS